MNRAWPLFTTLVVVTCAEPRPGPGNALPGPDAGQPTATTNDGAAVGDKADSLPTASDGPADAPSPPPTPDGGRSDVPLLVPDASPGKAAPGELCKFDQDCKSDICRREICCAGPCALCQSCRGPGGSCLNVPAGEDDYQGTTRCSNGRACDGAGNCRSTMAQSCSGPADCPSGFCSDGVCCDRVCTGACETCAGPFPGLCTGVSNRDDQPGCSGADAVCLGAGRCGTIDQRQDDAGATSVLMGQSVAQILVPGRQGRLGGVRIRANCTGEARLSVAVVEVAAGRPGEQVLATSALAQDQLALPPGGGAPGISLFPFDPPVPVTAGRPVALVVSDSNGFCSITMQGHLTPADPYPAGAVFRRLPGQGWVQETGDIWFETIVTP